MAQMSLKGMKQTLARHLNLPACIFDVSE